MLNKVLCLLALLALTACSQTSTTHTPPSQPAHNTTPDLAGVGGVTPRFEPPSRIGNKDYVVFGQDYKVWNGIDNYL